MNIESMIPEGWKFGYIISVYTKDESLYECQLEREGGVIYDMGHSPTDALQAACSQAREIAIKKLMEDCISREDTLPEPVKTKPCRSPYCECDVGKCTHPGFHDARGN